LDKAAADQPAAESGAPVFSSYQQGRQKRRGPLVALLMLGLAAGGFYAAWTYQPGFRAIAQPQIDRVLALAGRARQPQSLPPAPVPSAAKPSVQLAPATTTSAPVISKPEASKPGDNKPSDSKKDAAAATSSDAQLPGENSAIILSSKGAEKRLAHSVPPKYPVEARSGEAQGTVVLKAVVDENGKVEGVRLVEGNATLATAAINAVKQWRYRPYVRDGEA